jgi:gliding motility-associated-like protein
LETRQIPEGKVQNGQQVDLIALATGQNLAYSWEPKDMVTCQSCPITKTNPVSKTTTFKVQVRDTVFNCFTEKEIIVQTNCVIEIPNFLTPNNDNFNDFLFLKQNECIVNVSSLRVFNRWGKEVHFVENLPNIQETELWRPEQTGVYYYQMEVNTTEGGKNKFHGWIQVTK